MAAEESSRELAAILLDQADRLFAQYATKEVLGAADLGTWPAALWASCEEAGFPLALVPEEAGGVGLGFTDVAPLIRRSAYHGVPIPLGETMLANALWAEAGGEAPAGPVSLGPTNARDQIALTTGDNGSARLDGIAQRVPWASQAGHVLVLASDATCEHLCLVPAGTGHTAMVRNLASEPRETLSFEAAALPAAAIRPAPALAEAVLLHGAALRTLQMAGAMERCLAYALTYANERVQFGRPLAKFQAMQHMLAIAAGHVAVAAAAADSLAESHGTPAFAFAVGVAKARAGEAAGHVAAICHQAHGAMGFTQEHPLHFATRRLWAWRDEFGAESFWQARLGRLACRLGGEGLWPLVTDGAAA